MGTTIFNRLPHPTETWVQWECVNPLNTDPSILYYEVDTAAVYSFLSSKDNDNDYWYGFFTTDESTRYTTATRTFGTSVYTTVIPVTSSSGSEDTSSTDTAYPTSSSDYYYYPGNDSYYGDEDVSLTPSNAVIAGAVAGPLLALVAVGCLVFWLRRHKQRKLLVENGGGSGSGPGIQAVTDLPCIQVEFVQQPPEVAKTSDATPPAMCELEATEVVHHGHGPFQATGGGGMRL